MVGLKSLLRSCSLTVFILFDPSEQGFQGTATMEQLPFEANIASMPGVSDDNDAVDSIRLSLVT